MATLKTEIGDLAAKYKEAKLSINTETKTGTYPTSVYTDNLIEGLTPETVELVRKNDSMHLAAATKAAGEDSLEACTKNKDLGTVTTVIPMTGKDNMKLVYTHEKQVRDMQAKDGSMVTRHGHIAAQIDLYGSAGSRGQLAVVRSELSEAALAKASK